MPLQRSYRSSHPGFTCFDGIGLTAPQVWLPAHINTGAKAVAGRTWLALATAGTQTGSSTGQPAGFTLLQLGTRLTQCSLRALDTGVGHQGLINQGCHLRIPKLQPPAAQVLRCSSCLCGTPLHGHIHRFTLSGEL